MTTRQEKRHPSPKEFEFLLPIEQHIKNIILKSEQELCTSRIQAWVYEQEVATPTHVGRQKAEENFGLFQKQGKYLEQNITLIREYAKAHNIQI